MAKRAKPITSANVARITPKILTWAIDRQALSREKIASTLKVKPEQIEAWEHDTPVPTPKLERLSVLLAVPYGFFYLDDPPTFDLPVPDMRSMDSSYRPTPNFLELLNDALVKRDWYRDYLLEQDAPALSFVGRFTISDPVPVVAADIRAELTLDTARNGIYNLDDYSLALAKRAEAKRILVIRTGFVGNSTRRAIGAKEVQGFALSDPLAPMVFINTSDYKAPQVFTWAHEMAHLWVGNSAIDKPNDGESSSNTVESFCNAVATEVLVPASEFVSAWKFASGGDRVEAMARRFWVSAFVVIRRAKELGVIGFTEAEALRAVAANKITAKKKQDGGLGYYKTAVARVGHLFTDAVAAEFAQGNIVLTHASRLLNMKAYTAAKFLNGGAAT